MEIRQATIFDHTQLLNHLVKWFDELTIQGFPGICSFTGTWLADLIATQLVIIAEVDGKIIGSIGMRESYFGWNNETKVLMNEFFMTDVESRKTGVADKLLEAVKFVADKSGATILLGHMTGTDAELKDRYFKIHGFHYGGGNFLYKKGE